MKFFQKFDNYAPILSWLCKNFTILVKIRSKTKAIICREEKWIGHSIFLQNEAKRCYIVTLYNISSKQCHPIRNFVPKSPKMYFFREKSGNREFFKSSIFVLYMNRLAECVPVTGKSITCPSSFFKIKICKTTRLRLFPWQGSFPFS